jgi:hypothetical protein
MLRGASTAAAQAPETHGGKEDFIGGEPGWSGFADSLSRGITSTGDFFWLGLDFVPAAPDPKKFALLQLSGVRLSLPPPQPTAPPPVPVAICPV